MKRPPSMLVESLIMAERNIHRGDYLTSVMLRNVVADLYPLRRAGITWGKGWQKPPIRHDDMRGTIPRHR